MNAITAKYEQQQFTQESYSKLTGEILLTLKDAGYYFSILNLSETMIQISRDSIFLNPEFILHYNDKTVLDTIYFAGLNKTNPQYLAREFKNFENRTLSDPIIREIKRKLEKLKFLELVGREEIVKNKNQGYGLLLPVEEKNNNSFQGIAGFVPGKGSEKGYFTGKFDIALSNLTGMGRKLNLHWSRMNRNSQEFHIEFFTPWIWKYNYSGQISFDQTLRDTTLASRALQASIGRQLTSALGLRLNLEYESHLPTPSGQEIYGLTPRKNNYIGLGVDFDNRESIFNPLSGGTFNSGFLLGRNQIGGKSKPVCEIKVNSTYNIKLMDKIVVNTGINFQGKWKKGAKSDYSDYYWFGGAESMRGYPEDFFRGSRIGWTSFELRWLQGLYSRLYLFYERGYFYFQENGKNVQDFPSSFGAGVRLNTRAGIIGLDYAFDEDDSFTTAKIHIRFINRF